MERILYNEVPSEIFEKLRAIEDYFEKTSIELPLLELLRLRASQLNGCAYCVDMHYKELKKAGETELRLSSLCVWQETPYFSDKERAVLQFTEVLTKLDVKPISDDIYNRLLEFFSKEELCNLTLAISQINTWNRLMKVFRFVPGEYKVS
ncbi:MAG: carboxymuconolactone decarboxylase family protein [Flavobacteriaceae bacterium]|nr:carboxymuconolactone decarboxylase family protein [Flavobacteriaceae bacterium]